MQSQKPKFDSVAHKFYPSKKSNQNGYLGNDFRMTDGAHMMHKATIADEQVNT